MEFSDSPESDPVDAFVAQIQTQMQRMHEELPGGQNLEVLVPLASGQYVRLTSLGQENAEVIKVVGTDENGHDVCLLMHKSSFQVVLKKTSAGPEVKPGSAFKSEEPIPEISFDETA